MNRTVYFAGEKYYNILHNAIRAAKSAMDSECFEEFPVVIKHKDGGTDVRWYGRHEADAIVQEYDDRAVSGVPE